MHHQRDLHRAGQPIHDPEIVLCVIEECTQYVRTGKRGQGRVHEMKGLRAVCGKCGHATTVCGRSGASRRAALAMLRAECPRDETNLYRDLEQPLPATVAA